MHWNARDLGWTWTWMGSDFAVYHHLCIWVIFHYTFMMWTMFDPSGAHIYDIQETTRDEWEVHETGFLSVIVYFLLLVEQR